MESQLTIQIVGWNSEKTLPFACTGLAEIAQMHNIQLRYIDNASKDGSVDVIRRLLPEADIVQLEENVGFAPAHNIGFSRCDTQFVLVHDPDVKIEWEGIQKLLTMMRDNPQVGALQGKLLRAHEEGIIDSVGIVKTLGLNGKERGAGQKDTNQYNKRISLFAVTGACALYRMQALQQVAHSPEEIFDNDFFAYKEDVDLGWRLNRAGWDVLYEPVFMGYHARTMGQRGKLPWPLQIKKLPERLKSIRTRYSFRNYIWMLMKNMTIRDEILHDLFIIPRIVVMLVLSCLYPPLFSVWGEILHGIPNIMHKRQAPLW